MTCTRYGPSFKTFVALCNFRTIIDSEEKVFSVTSVESDRKCDGYRPNYRHLTPKVDWNGLCPARFLCHRNGSPDEILSNCLAQTIRESIPKLILAS
jgi:hypothetical protein